MTSPLRVVVADDDVIAREGVAAVARSLGHDVVGTADSLPSLLHIVSEQLPDVALVDIRMPPTHTLEGLNAAAEIRSRYPATGVVVLSQFLAANYALRLLSESSSGVGYVLKTDVQRTERLGAVISAVARGGTVVDRGIVDRLRERSARQHRLDALTEREQEVLALLAEGLANTAIAAQLYLGLRTVDSHVAAIIRKLGLGNRMEDSNRRVRAALLYLDGRDDELTAVL